MTEVPSNEPHQQDHILRSAKPTSCPNKAQAKQIALTPTNHPSPGGFLLPCRNSTNARTDWHYRAAVQDVLYRPKRDRGDRGDSLTFEQKSCVRFFL